MSPLSTTVVAAIAVDLIAITILAVPLYFRRHRRKDLMLSYVALNVGVLGVALALAGSEVGIGLGLGLFGVLSIVRLRSDQITQAEIAYYFTALALGLLAGIGAGSLWMPVAFSALLLTVLYVVDHPLLFGSNRRRVVTLDAAYLDEAVLRDALSRLVGGPILRMEVLETDLVRDTTVVDVRYRARRGGPQEAIGAWPAAGEPRAAGRAPMAPADRSVAPAVPHAPVPNMPVGRLPVPVPAAAAAWAGTPR